MPKGSMCIGFMIGSLCYFVTRIMPKPVSTDPITAYPTTLSVRRAELSTSHMNGKGDAIISVKSHSYMLQLHDLLSNDLNKFFIQFIQNQLYLAYKLSCISHHNVCFFVVYGYAILNGFSRPLDFP
jgi:hypothetical protein